MKLATFRPSGAAGALAGEVESGRVHAFEGDLSVSDVLAGSAEPRRGGRSWPLAEVELLAPVEQPRTVYGIGLNYAKHIEETGGSRPEQPIVFVKVAGSLTGPAGPVRCPSVVHSLDYEGELAIVMGAAGRIAGYTIADDLSARDLQGREPQWTRAKGADTFCPIGPWVTTADEVGDPETLWLRTWVNGELRQDSTTADLIFGCNELVDFIGQTCTLMPGDLILTGTPSGVGQGFDPPRFLQAGDTVRIEIERLGWIEHRVV